MVVARGGWKGRTEREQEQENQIRTNSEAKIVIEVFHVMSSGTNSSCTFCCFFVVHALFFSLFFI